MRKESLEFSNIFSPIAQDFESRKNNFNKGGNEIMEFDEQYHLKGRPEWIRSLYKKIDEYCLTSLGREIDRTSLQTYIRYNINGKMFCRIFISLINLRIYLKLDYSKLEKPPVFIRDYSGTARTKDTIELLFDNEEEYSQNETAFFDITSTLIKKSFLGVSSGEMTVRPVKPTEIGPAKASKVTSINLTLGDDSYVTITMKIHKSQKEILERILRDTIFSCI